MDKSITIRQRELLEIIYHYIQSSGYPPTFEEMRQRLKVRSNQSIVDLLNKLKEKHFIKRTETAARCITILPLGFDVLDKIPLVPFLGISHAGAPITAIEITGEWTQIPGDVARLNANVYILKISGDSMINAGIDHGDLVLVKEQKEFISGDIVITEIEEQETTVKRFISDDQPPFVYLQPENPKYQPIPFTHRMKMIGKVISVLKNGTWTSAH